jgi:hypothetical protein
VNCGGGLQNAIFIITQAAQFGGLECSQANNSIIERRACNIEGCPGAAIDDKVVVISGQVTTIPILENDAGLIQSVRSVTRSQRGANITLTASRQRLVYMSKPGYTGTDTFQYTVVDGRNSISTATVQVTVKPGSCIGNLCIQGSCRLGVCNCKAGTGLLPTFVPNTEAVASAARPFVPACRFTNFKPLSGYSMVRAVQAQTGSTLAVRFSLGSSCFKGLPVKGVGFRKTRDCIINTAIPLPAVNATVSSNVTCSQGVYSFNVKAPKQEGCYNFVLQLADGSNKVTILKTNKP